MDAILLLPYTFLGLFVNAEMLIGTVFRAPRATADSSQNMTISALGRSFTVGALYNARTDQLVSPGLTLWDLDTLKKNLHTEDHPFSKVVLSTGNSMDKKASLFDISKELKMSLIAGLVKVNGAAKYINKKPSSNYMTEVGLLHKTFTHIEQMNMELLAADKIQHPQVLDKEKEATHIVTKITYGANVVLSLTKEVNSMSQMEEVRGKLKSAAKCIASSISGSVPMDLTDEQKRDYSSITVDFYGDVSPRKPPITFSDAVETCKSLSSLINKTTAIPIQVHLSPLSRLDTSNSKNSRLVKNISAYLWRKTEKRHEKYEKIFRNIGDLSKYAAYQSLHSFKDHVDEFQSALDVHKIQFERKLLHVVPKIRGGMEEIELTKILDESKSCFTMNKLEQWTVFKKREARTLKHLLSVEPNIIYTEPGRFDQLLANYSIHFVVVLKLKLYPSFDPYTKCLANVCNSTIKYNSWLTRKIRKQMRKASVQYIRMYSLNKEFLPNPSTAFAILEELHRGAPLHVAIQIFENGEEVESNFQFPSITITTTADVKCEETNISWMTTEKNTYLWLSDKYHVSYKQKMQDSWTTYTSMEASTTINISAGYKVLIMANCRFGICAHKKMTVQDLKHCTASRDCADIKEQHPQAISGTYEIKPSGSPQITVFCDMQTLGGGWTVFQRRMNGKENFRRNWTDYKQGFGNVAEEHWLGNGAIHSLTYSIDSKVELLVELQEPGRSCMLDARYSNFFIGTEKENYKLYLGKFTGGSAGDSGQGLSNHNGTEFSTFDMGNDKDSCANQRNGGWWYMEKGMCEHANLNGLYNNSTCVSQFGHINWDGAHGHFFSFPWTEMKMRRTDFKLGNQENNWCTQLSCHIKCEEDTNCLDRR